MTAEDPDLHRRDLRQSIDAGDAPEWRLEVQVMPFAEAEHYRFNPFDLTKVWPRSDYPPIQVGRMVLDRNPQNFFAEVEQAGFSPANLVTGIGLSPDKMLMGRTFSYHDTQDDDFGQAGALYREVMSDTDREHLVANIVGHASDDVASETRLRVVAYWSAVDAAHADHT